MAAAMVGPAKVEECPKCEGLWIDAATFAQICADRENQAAVLAIAAKVPTGSVDIEKVCYLPCPSCRKLMNRVNFAHCSNVVVDVCKPHGIWFDRDELRRIVEFIRTGGLVKARELEVEDLESRRRAATAPHFTTTADTSASLPTWSGHHMGISLIGALIGSIFD
jgi:Zn-finger nucleic acid-binding protein